MEPDLQRVAEAVRQRRLELDGLTQAEAAGRAGVSDTTWNQVETGKPVGPRSRVKIAHSLGWRPISFDAIARGGEPIPLDLPPTDGPGSDDELVQAVRELTEVVRLLRADLERDR